LIQGTVVNASGGVVTVSGGAGGDGNGGAGGGGRFLFGQNTSGGFGGTVNGSSSTMSTVGPKGGNPFVGGTPSTPFIPGLTDGSITSAAVYGLGDGTLTAANVATAMGGSLPAFDVNGVPLASAGEALVRLHLVSGTTYNNNFNSTDKGGANYDTLVLLNLSTGAISTPQFGVDGANQQLLLDGYTRNPIFGGSGPALLPLLALGGAYATLLPAGSMIDPATISGDFGAGVQTALAANLQNGQALYIPVPEPSTVVLALLGGALALAAWRRRRRA